ncbi:1162_t:CDS:2, partial [Dentiscutata erythropus]
RIHTNADALSRILREDKEMVYIMDRYKEMEPDEEVLQNIIRTLSPNPLPATFAQLSQKNSSKYWPRDWRDPTAQCWCDDKLYSPSDDCIKCKCDLRLWTTIKSCPPDKIIKYYWSTPNYKEETAYIYPNIAPNQEITENLADRLITIVEDLPVKRSMAGDKVLLYDAAKANSHSGKLLSQWLGPFIIAQRVAQDVYKLKTMEERPLDALIMPSC